jgi:hypothetical protein
MISAFTGALQAAASRPPWICDRCLRTVLISWIEAPLLSRSRVTTRRSAMVTPSTGSDISAEPPPEISASSRSKVLIARAAPSISRAAVSPASSGTGWPASTQRMRSSGSAWP